MKKVISFLDLDPSKNNPSSILKGSTAYNSDGSIDYSYVYQFENGNMMRLIPPEEDLPLTRKQKKEISDSLKDYDMSEFSSETKKDDLSVGTRKWKDHLDEYFRERGITTEEYWKKRGFDENEIDWEDE